MVTDRSQHSDASFVLAGADLAPDLMASMMSGYLNDYPGVSVQIIPGGASHALEALLNSETDIALTLHPPTPPEQALFLETQGDTTLWYSIGLGGLAIIAANECPLDTLSAQDLESFLRGEPDAPFDRLYVPDPNSGLWDALLHPMAMGPAPVPPGTVFLKDAAAVREAVASDLQSIGLESTLAPHPKPGTRTLFVRSAEGPGLRPDLGTVGTGEYPLHHFLYVVCLPDGNREGAKFVTHLTSARGQRLVERAGYLPSRRVPREIHLSRDPIGGTP